MVPPAFGVSAGDFFAVIDLTVKIGEVLRVTGGATSEYRLVHQSFTALTTSPRTDSSSAAKSVDTGYFNALRGLVLTCLVPLREFAEKLDNQYFAALNVGSTKNMVIRGGRKAYWAVSAAEKSPTFVLSSLRKLSAYRCC